jgi:hypothetical protein
MRGKTCHQLLALRPVYAEGLFKEDGLSGGRRSKRIGLSRHRRAREINQIRGCDRLFGRSGDPGTRCESLCGATGVRVRVPQRHRLVTGVQAHVLQHPAPHDPEANNRNRYRHPIAPAQTSFSFQQGVRNHHVDALVAIYGLGDAKITCKRT